MHAEHELSLPPIDHESAPPEARAVLDKALRQVGFIPNMYARMVHSPGLLDTYLHGYALFRERSGLSPAEQEVAFLAISRENGCSYCVSAHSFLADAKSGVPAAVIEAIRADAPIPDPRLGALAQFTRRMVRSRGLPDRADVAAFLEAGYEERHVLEVILAIAVKTLSNYANHLFHTPVDDLFAAHAWSD